MVAETSSTFQDFDDAEETLSFCDLPLTSSASSDWDAVLSNEDKKSSSFDQDFFEFFSSEEVTASIYPKENIIFCGKLIPHKGAKAPDQKAQNPEITTKPKNTSKKSRIFPWKSHSFNNSITSTSSSKQQQKQGKKYRTCKSLPVLPVADNKRYVPTRKFVKKYDSSMKKVSILGTPMKSRWYLFALGVGKFPTEMELSDMKTRQSKRMSTPIKMFPSVDASHDMVKSSSCGKRAKDLWGLLRVKVSFRCINPQI